MNKLYGDGPNGKVMLCILEPGNINRLTKLNQPITIDLNAGPWKHGLPAKLQVVISYSDTPVADARQISKLIGIDNVQDERAPITEKIQPHCYECKSTIEQLGVWRSDTSPLWITFCAVCGCVFGVSKPIEELKKEKPDAA
jgi:hypothetical protein